jgi:hypothetical protein
MIPTYAKSLKLIASRVLTYINKNTEKYSKPLFVFVWHFLWYYHFWLNRNGPKIKIYEWLNRDRKMKTDRKIFL